TKTLPMTGRTSQRREPSGRSISEVRANHPGIPSRLCACRAECPQRIGPSCTSLALECRSHRSPLLLLDVNPPPPALCRQETQNLQPIRSVLLKVFNTNVTCDPRHGADRSARLLFESV